MKGVIMASALSNVNIANMTIQEIMESEVK
jgi:hypothetical protein